MKCLMLGSGNLLPQRKLFLPGTESVSVEWTTLDNDADCKPDIIYDLNDIEHGWQIPVATCSFDEVHSYSVIAMYGRQGDAAGFFCGMQELWRVLKPGGLYIGGTPAAQDDWAWGDPSAKRNINGRTWEYLTRSFYDKLGVWPLSDYRALVDPCWWEIKHSDKTMVGDVSVHSWALKKV